MRETGASHSKMHHESNFAYGEILAAATLPWQPYGSLVPTAVQGRLSMIRRIPIGVVGAITPWNSPSVLGMRVVAPALALGNAVVLKPDPQTPVIGGAMFEAVFREAGLPDGLLQIVVGGADVGEALVTDPNVAMVSFTGSTAAGRRVGELAGARLKKVSLELGGNNAFIVLDDADLAAAVAAGAFSSFQFQGQVCFAAGRHIVHETIAGEYIDALTEKAKRLRMGDPFREDVQLGPIVNEKQVRRVDDIVRRSVDGGATLRVGGTYEGLFYQPTVLTDVTTDLPAWTDEIFGPVAPVTTFATDEEAVALANQSEYGLVGAVYSRSLSRGLAMANRIRAGMVHVNDGTLNDEATIPFGGTGTVGERHPLRRRGESRQLHRMAVGDGARRATDVPVLTAEDGVASITDVARLAGVSTATVSRVVSGVAVRGERGDPRARARCRPRARLRPERARARPAQELHPGRGRHRPRHHRPVLLRGRPGRGGRRVPGRVPGRHLQLRPRPRARALVRPAAALDARGDADLRRQRARRPGPQHRDAPAHGGDAGLRSGGRAPLAARLRRGRGRRRQRGRDREHGHRARGPRASPDRVPRGTDVAVRGPAAARRATAAASTRPASRSTSDWS